jgi:hypothetical protein
MENAHIGNGPLPLHSAQLSSYSVDKRPLRDAVIVPSSLKNASALPKAPVRLGRQGHEGVAGALAERRAGTALARLRDRRRRTRSTRGRAEIRRG